MSFKKGDVVTYLSRFGTDFALFLLIHNNTSFLFTVLHPPEEGSDKMILEEDPNWQDIKNFRLALPSDYAIHIITSIINGK